MAVRTTFVQDGAYNSPDLRYAQSMLVPRNNLGDVTPGLIDVGQPAALVTAGGGLNVSVGVFMAVAPDSGSGVYVGGNDAYITVPVPTPEVANNRVDLLCWRPLEGLATTSTGASTMGSVTLAGSASAASKQIVHGEIYFVKGTPSAGGSPTIPATPSGAVPLARVYVAGGATSIAAANITQVYTYLASAKPDVAAEVPSLRSVGPGRWQAAAGDHTHTKYGYYRSYTPSFVGQARMPAFVRRTSGAAPADSTYATPVSPNSVAGALTVNESGIYSITASWKASGPLGATGFANLAVTTQAAVNSAAASNRPVFPGESSVYAIGARSSDYYYATASLAGIFLSAGAVLDFSTYNAASATAVELLVNVAKVG